MKAGITVRLVGDPRQITYRTHDEQKYSNYKEGRILEFIKEKCGDCNCEVDTVTLGTNHRSISEICKFSNLAYPNFSPAQSDCTKPDGHYGLFAVRKQDVEDYVSKYKPMQLRERRTVQVVESAADVMNYGVSKGLAFDHVLIYTTEPIRKWLMNHNSPLAVASRAELYVAITRGRYSVAFVMDKDADGLTRYQQT
jgi:DNA helicase-2/ATP-dependent DNA helicase PcrA